MKGIPGTQKVELGRSTIIGPMSAVVQILPVCLVFADFVKGRFVAMTPIRDERLGAGPVRDK